MACPLLCLAKKDGLLQTIIDARNRNANLVLDVTPMLDMHFIMDSLVRNKYQSKINMMDAYEQIQVEMECVLLMALATPWGMYVSNVLQQGDCNGPSTFQRVISWALREEIRLAIHMWFDDIFAGTDSVLRHNKKLMWVYLHLKEEQLYISHKKFEPFAPILDILGCKVDTYRVHADSDKMAKVRNWAVPRDHNEVLQFLGLIEYLAHFMPNVSAFSGLLQTICSNHLPFRWTLLHQKCFDEIKTIVWEIPPDTIKEDKAKFHIWVITDTCPGGMGAVLVQGENWQTACPATFMLKKFTLTQCAYFTYELEALGILEALMKWLDELMGGQTFTVVTDHKALTYFKEKNHTAGCHIRW